MLRAASRCVPVAVVGRRLAASAAVAAAAAAAGPLPSKTAFDATDPRLAPDRQRMLAQFWTLRDYAVEPDSCRNASRVVAGFNALRNQYGHSPVDLHLQLQYFCGRGLHDRVVECLRESRRNGHAIDLPTYSMALASLSQDPARYHRQCRSMLSQMLASGHGADHGSFAAVLGAHVGAGDASRAITLVAQMVQRNMFPAAGQLDRVVALCCQRKLADEVAWLLQSAMYSPYPVGVQTAVQVVETFASSAPSKLLARGLPHLRLTTEPDLLAILQDTFRAEPEIAELMAAYKRGESRPDALKLEGRAPPMPAHLQEIHGRHGADPHRPGRPQRRGDPGRGRRHPEHRDPDRRYADSPSRFGDRQDRYRTSSAR